MDEANTDVIPGTLDLLILKTLSLQPMHGFGIARRVEQISRGVFKVNPGSLLTALKIAVLAPMPSASVSAPTAANPGLLRRRRAACLRSPSVVAIAFSHP